LHPKSWDTGFFFLPHPSHCPSNPSLSPDLKICLALPYHFTTQTLTDFFFQTVEEVLLFGYFIWNWLVGKRPKIESSCSKP
jgi:hypothetical protein